MKRYAFGVDVGGTSVKLGLLAEDGTLLEKWEIPTRRDRGAAMLLPDIAESLAAATARHGLGREALCGVGLGVPGAVTAGRHVAPCVNLDGWGGDVGAALAARCGLPVSVVNDANAAALGEMWRGGGAGERNLVFLTLGTGVGGGVIVDGHLLGGVHGCGGELGHIKVRVREPEPCGCGKRGCLEQYASATGLVRTARKLLEASARPSALRDAALDARAVFDCARAGDALALEAVELLADSLGQALAAVSCVCDPEAFVLGGGVSAAGAILLDAVAAAFRRYAFPPAEGTRFALAKLGNEAGVYGCAKLALDAAERGTCAD